ncbi:class I SAM-dependent methyltransferase [Candidatus Woesearchaeota archaeon]|nr:class I SAM-dependent methyltransferase [Candidatus Woesearchaeota archaeon]
MIHSHSSMTYPGRYDFRLKRDGLSLAELLNDEALMVLDVGCYVGFETTMMTSSYLSHYFVGMDINPDNVRTARSGRWSLYTDLECYGRLWTRETIDERIFESDDRTIAVRNIPRNLKFIVGDYDNMPFRRKTFDIIFFLHCGNGYATRNDRLNGVMGHEVSHKALPILKPGGMLITDSAVIRK